MVNSVKPETFFHSCALAACSVVIKNTCGVNRLILLPPGKLTAQYLILEKVTNKWCETVAHHPGYKLGWAGPHPIKLKLLEVGP